MVFSSFQEFAYCLWGKVRSMIFLILSSHCTYLLYKITLFTPLTLQYSSIKYTKLVFCKVGFMHKDLRWVTPNIWDYTVPYWTFHDFVNGFNCMCIKFWFSFFQNWKSVYFITHLSSQSLVQAWKLEWIKWTPL